MTLLLVLLLVLLLSGYLVALVAELRRDGYGVRPAPRSQPDGAAVSWGRL